MSADTPRVEACIEAVMRRYPSDKATAYYEAVHQQLAPLARELEREVATLRQAAAAQQVVAVDEQALLAARAEGRAEAMLIVQSMDPEDALNDCMVGSGPCPATGEYDTHWDVEKLRAKFMVGDTTINMETKAELAYYEYTEARMVLEYEAMQRRAQQPAPPAEKAVCQHKWEAQPAHVSTSAVPMERCIKCWIYRSIASAFGATSPQADQQGDAS